MNYVCTSSDYVHSSEHIKEIWSFLKWLTTTMYALIISSSLQVSSFYKITILSLLSLGWSFNWRSFCIKIKMQTINTVHRETGSFTLFDLFIVYLWRTWQFHIWLGLFKWPKPSKVGKDKEARQHTLFIKYALFPI